MEVKLKEVCYQVPKTNQEILSNIQSKFESGKITAIVGPMGSGKTSLLDIIALRKYPTKGIVTVGEHASNITSNPQERKKYDKNIGYVPSFLDDYFSFDTVEKEFQLVLERLNYKPTKQKEQIYHALEIVGLDVSFLKRDPFSLSQGEAFLVSFAIALSYNPKILLFDEPTVGLDASYKRKFISLLAMLKVRYHKTIIIAGNDVDFLYQIADYFIVLKEGKILFQGLKQELSENLELLEREQIPLPEIITFVNVVKRKKGIKLGVCYETNDLVKEILRKRR